MTDDLTSGGEDNCMDEQDISDALEQLGGADEIRRRIERFSEDVRFRNENFRSLMEQYPNKWIAILNRQVVAISKSQRGLRAQLKKAGIDPTICLWEFLDPDPKTQILMRTGQSVRFFI